MKTYTQLANEATAALKAFNDVHRTWQADAKKGGYSSHFKAPQLSEQKHYDLLVEVAYFDGEAQESLETMRQDMGIDEDGEPLDDVHGYPMHSRKSLEADRAFKEAGL